MKKFILLILFSFLTLSGCTILVKPSEVIAKGIFFEFKSAKNTLNMESCIINSLRETRLIKPTSARADTSSRIYGELMDQLVIVVDIVSTTDGTIVKYYKDFSYVLGSEVAFENAVKKCQ